MCGETIARALERAADTKACLIGDGVLGETVRLFKELFAGADRAIVIDDPRTRAAAGADVAGMLRANGVDVAEHVIEPGGKIFHGDYRYVDEVREAIKAAGVERGGKKIVPHGIQVGVFTLFMCRIYEQMLAFDYSKLDVEACLGNWKPLAEQERIGAAMFAGTKFPDLGVKAVRAKFIDREATRARLEDFKARWLAIKARLSEQIVPAAEIERRLKVVGAPTTPEGIGSTVEASLADVRKTVYMRDRYMALDFLDLTGQLDAFAQKAFRR